MIYHLSGSTVSKKKFQEYCSIEEKFIEKDFFRLNKGTFPDFFVFVLQWECSLPFADDVAQDNDDAELTFAKEFSFWGLEINFAKTNSV